MARRSRTEWREGLRPLLARLGTHKVALDKGMREAAGRWSQRRRQARSAFRPHRGRLLWLLPVPLVLAAVLALASGQVGALVANSLAYALYVAGALLARRGFQQEAEYHGQRLAEAPSPPLKILAALTIGLATFFTAWLCAHQNLPAAMAFGIGSVAAFVLLYGLDPRQSKGVPARAGVDAGQTRRLLAQAEAKVVAIEQAAGHITQPELRARVARISTQAHDILSEIEREPGDLHRARRFLTTYLDGAQRVVTGYVDTHPHGGPHQLEDNFRRVLSTIEEVFDAQHARLLEKDLRELDVQIEVLETQLRREGF